MPHPIKVIQSRLAHTHRARDALPNDMARQGRRWRPGGRQVRRTEPGIHLSNTATRYRSCAISCAGFGTIPLDIRTWLRRRIIMPFLTLLNKFRFPTGAMVFALAVGIITIWLAADSLWTKNTSDGGWAELGKAGMQLVIVV